MKISILTILASITLIFAATAQDSGKYGDTPEQVAKCRECLSLYREFRDQKIVGDALNYWRCAYKTCPESALTLYIDGARFYGDILDGMYEDSTRTTERNAYVDTLMGIYDQRIALFGDEGKVLTFKANDLFKYNPSRVVEANKMLKRSLEIEGNKSDAIAASKYYQTLYEMYKDKKATKSDLLVEYIPVLDILDYNIARLEDEGERERYLKAKSNLDAFFIKIAECEDIYRILKERLAETPDDIELNNKALAVMNKRDCTDDPLYLQVAERVYKNSPTAPAAYSLGTQKLKAKDYSTAAKYFDEAIQLCDGCVQEPQYLLRAGQASIIQGNPSKAKAYANKILAKEPKNGEALMLIGDAITSSAASCDDGKLGKASAYWLATDYYARARSADASIADKANQKIATYSKYFPLKTEIFFNSLTVGASYTVACFGENTTVRSSD